MPFEAAKAVAATFCYSIRYALTPIFGPHFPASCIPPDSEKFGEMVIDAAITQRCTEEARAYRLMDTGASTGASSAAGSPLTPVSPSFPRYIKQLRPKSLRTAGLGSGYSTDSSHDDNYTLASSSPHVRYQNAWTPLNTPRSVANHHPHLPSPREILSSISASRSRNRDETLETSTVTSTPSLSSPIYRDRKADEDYDTTSSEESSCEDVVNEDAFRKRQASPGPSDEKAAYLLMSLRMQKADLRTNVTGRKRRASA